MRNYRPKFLMLQMMLWRKCFSKGLKKYLSEHVVRYRPEGMDAIVDIAKMIEEQEAAKASFHSRSFRRTSSAPALQLTQKISYVFFVKKS